MDYFVLGPDGAEYGPANLATIKEWVGQGRVSANTKLKDFQTGAVREASTFTELFPAAAVPPVSAASPYPRQYATPPTATRPVQTAPASSSPFSGPGSGDLWWALARSLAALVICAISPGAGIITAVYGIFASARVMQAGHRLGMASMIVSVVVLVVVGIRAALYFMMPHAPRY